ncbi:protein adenylyltransferase SelO [Pedobacter sp. AW31-3R]|uniref:protein adenylyltransferase SelO n=1 Tax=Pedobacter sp. AW31-3R TaxID=3445781 RepID=UPI003F9FC3C3
MENLSIKKYKNEFTAAFDGDESGLLNPRQTPGFLYAKTMPTPVKKPELLGWSEDLASELEINTPLEDDLNILGGNLVTPSMYPYAACYAGHQFGNWAGQLGDGRAITLGEWENSKGQTYELQLKGAGPTPYSRRGDGRAVLRSSMREYLMSEAMFYLGVPTTRALALVSTGDQVLRDLFYNGNAAYEPGAIVMRAAPSFLRFGNFEMLAARQDEKNLQKLTDWTIAQFYPHITGAHKVIQWYKEVVEKTATLMVEWIRVGFVHGVMNTDNMSVLGLTIDYGPFSFLDAYDPDFTPNTTDLPGRRYAFGKQHTVAYWNLGCLASAIAPLLDSTEELVAELEAYEHIYFDKYYTMMGNKLGLDKVRQPDRNLVDLFEQTLAQVKPDMTIFFQLLTDLPETMIHAGKNLAGEDILLHFKPCFYAENSAVAADAFCNLIQIYIQRITADHIINPAGRLLRMRAANPRFILRNYLLHMAITDMEKGDPQLFLKLKEALKTPYSSAHDEFFKLRPEWANEQPGSSTLSCSS